MADKETALQTKFQTFLKQRKTKTNVSTQEAQRLINLYRVLDDFGPDFVDEYNKMLKNSADEVQMALKALVGGQEVCQYLEFLEAEDQKEESTKNADGTNQQSGWLPSPDQEERAEKVNGNYVSVSEWQSFVKDQDEKFTRLVDELRAEQASTLNRLMDQLSGGLKGFKGSATETVKAPTPQYSEIIEEKK